MIYPEGDMQDSQEFELPLDSPELERLKQRTVKYEEEYASAFYKDFPEFNQDQAQKAMVLAHKFALERARHERKLEEEGGKDPLTGLDNRKRFAEDGRREIANAIRSNQGFAIFFVDIDHFKEVNDSSSHATGDEVLRQTTQQLLKGSRKGDTLARIGGEEIVGLVKIPSDKSLNAAERWRKNFEDANITYKTGEGETRKVTVSIGVAIFNPLVNIDQREITGEYINKQLNAVVRSADIAMYAAKGAGRNRVGIANLDGNFATLDPKENGNGNILTVRTTPDKPPTDDYFKLAA